MSRHEHPTDRYVRGLPLVSDEQLRSLSDSEAKQALFEEIITMDTDTKALPATSGGRYSRRTIVLVATLALLSFAAVGTAAVYSAIQTTTAVACHGPDGGVSVMDSVTGDSVTDCAEHWRRITGEEPPALVAYDNGIGGVEVVPHGADVPGSWQILEPGVVQDARLIELEAALGDHIDGLLSACHRVDSGRAIAERELDRLGLDTWETVSERGSADGETTCTFYFLDSERQRVVLIPLEGMIAPGETPHTMLADRLGEELDRCLSAQEAADLTREIAADVGVVEEGLNIRELTDPDSECARAHVNVGGRVDVTIRGPGR